MRSAHGWDGDWDGDGTDSRLAGCLFVYSAAAFIYGARLFAVGTCVESVLKGNLCLKLT